MEVRILLSCAGVGEDGGSVNWKWEGADQVVREWIVGETDPRWGRDLQRRPWPNTNSLPRTGILPEFVPAI